jgi:hypothetical protein
MTHHDPDRAEFGYVADDDWGRSYGAFKRAESRREREATYLADSFVTGQLDDDWSREYFTRNYRRAVAAEQYARAVWQQVRDEQAVA